MRCEGGGMRRCLAFFWGVFTAIVTLRHVHIHTHALTCDPSSSSHHACQTPKPRSLTTRTSQDQLGSYHITPLPSSPSPSLLKRLPEHACVRVGGAPRASSPPTSAVCPYRAAEGASSPHVVPVAGFYCLLGESAWLWADAGGSGLVWRSGSLIAPPTT